MSRSRRAALFAGGGLVVAYLAMLQVRAADREPPLAVVWTSGAVATTVRNPRTGLEGWAVAADVDALVDRVEAARGWRDTETLHADAAVLSVHVADVRGHRVALAEVPAGQLPGLAAAVAAAAGGAVDLLVVATTEAPSAVLAAVPGPVAVLPGAYGDGGEASGADRLVAPWIDSRYRVGMLTVRFDGGLALEGTAVDIPLHDAPADAPTLLGEGSPAFTHDLIDFTHSGLGDALLERILAVTHADVALVNYLALRGGLVGPIDLQALEKALPFDNEVVLQTFDSTQLAAILAEGAGDDTKHLLVSSRVPLGSPLPARAWRVATVDYLANGGRGAWQVFTQGAGRVRTRLTLNMLALSLLRPGGDGGAR